MPGVVAWLAKAVDKAEENQRIENHVNAIKWRKSAMVASKSERKWRRSGMAHRKQTAQKRAHRQNRSSGARAWHGIA